MDPHDVLAVTLVDLRANLEAKQRALDATEECVEAYRSTRDVGALTAAARHIRAINELHVAIGDTVETAQHALQSLMSPGTSSSGIAVLAAVIATQF